MEVRDETVQLELEMYKKQCRELIQERAILQSLAGHPVVESTYRVVEEGTGVAVGSSTELA